MGVQVKTPACCDAGTGGSARVERERQRLGGQVGIGRRGGEGELGELAHALVADGTEHRSDVDLGRR